MSRNLTVVLMTAAAALVNGSAGRAQGPSPQGAEAGTGTPERTFEGRVIGPDGAAVSGLVVLLHRVTNQGGEQLARSVTSDDGRFTLRYQPPNDAGGVYFVVARYEGRAYFGPLLRAPFAEAEDYEMQVGVPGVGDLQALMRRSAPASPMGSASPANQPPAPGAMFVAVMLSAAIAIGAVLVIRGAGPSRRRKALIGLARLEETGPSGGSPSAYARRRRELLRRVKEA